MRARHLVVPVALVVAGGGCAQPQQSVCVERVTVIRVGDEFCSDQQHYAWVSVPKNRVPRIGARVRAAKPAKNRQWQPLKAKNGVRKARKGSG